MTRPSNHHLLYERTQYTSNRVLRSLRSHHGLIVPLNVIDHRDLHRTFDTGKFPTVPKPDIEAARYFLSDVVLPPRPDKPPFEVLEQAIGWFALTNNKATAEHLALQRDFIAERFAERAA